MSNTLTRCDQYADLLLTNTTRKLNSVYLNDCNKFTSLKSEKYAEIHHSSKPTTVYKTVCCYVSRQRKGRIRRRWGRARVESSAISARIEAPKAPRRWNVGKGVPLPTRGGVWGESCASSPEIFSILSSKRRVLVHSWTDKTYFWSAWRLEFLASSRPGVGRGIAPSPPPWIRPGITLAPFFPPLTERFQSAAVASLPPTATNHVTLLTYWRCFASVADLTT